MTLDELAKIFRAGLFAHLGKNPYATVGEGDIAGIRAVVLAIRDEIGLDPGYCDECKDNKKLFREILASDGVEAAGTDTAGTEPQLEAIERSAPAAAPVCEACNGLGKIYVRTTHDFTDAPQEQVCEECIPAAAPDVCVWTKITRAGDYRLSCGSFAIEFSGGNKECPSCGLPISFKEAAR